MNDKSPTAEQVLSELQRAKVIFQQRAIAAIMDIPAATCKQSLQVEPPNKEETP